jgi:hypothetical protein
MKAFIICIAIAFALCSFDARSQCGRIGLIGEFNGWSEDLFMNRDPVVPEEFSMIILLTAADDFDGNGYVEMKFRENSDWANNWGNVDFPGGTGLLNGPNIPVPIGNYLVTFNCFSHEYYFLETCGAISLIGEFNNWAGDIFMIRNPLNPDLWTTNICLNEGSNVYDPPDIIEMKFRENADWAVNWGAPDFPSGIGIQGGSNIPVPLTSTGITTDYLVTFNCVTGEYNFTETSGPVSLIGEFNDWAGDLFMERDASNPDRYSMLITLYLSDDPNSDGIVEMKFRENADWTINWGSDQFPSGIVMADGPNIPVPLDYTGLTTDYMVTFDYSTLEFSFQSTSGAISIIGAFIGWNGDIPMNRLPESPNDWKLTRCWYENTELKFRENKDWSVNWGNTSWPSGIGLPNGPNLPLIAGTYDVTFNAATGAYNFVSNPDACGEIGLIGDFNNWGDNGLGFPADLYLIRDPVYPNQFSLDYLFADNTYLLFRLNGDPTLVNVWGGTSLCQTGIKDAALTIPVSVGNYHITFDYNSGDYCLTNLDFTYSVEAPKVFSMIIDGELNESAWDISQQVNKIVNGTLNSDLNDVNFGVSYNDYYLYIGVNVKDYFVNTGELVEFFLDGDHSAGPYDDHDVYFRIYGTGYLELIFGPSGGITIQSAFKLNPDGYTIEVAIPLGPLGITAFEGGNTGFDIIVWDDDSGGSWRDYALSWNGNMEDLYNTSQLGHVIFGSLNAGLISLYNPVLGDVILRPHTDQPTTYLATYNFDTDFGVVFRNDKANNTAWGSDVFPNGTAVIGGPEIPVTAGRYRISFDCQTGAFSFTDAPAGDNVAMAYYTEEAPIVDGSLDEYDLDYGCEILVAGTGPIDNTVNWGARWDLESFYIGVQVTDEALFGSGNPWDNDGIEFYMDGNNDKDGIYDADFDTQIIMDILNQSNPWFKADGVPITNYNAQFTYTGLGYNMELRLGWNNFGFEPGRGRVMGWSLGNDDNDNGLGRDYQSVWYGTANNWSNTADLGDLQLADGPYTDIPEAHVQGDILIYPNPTGGDFSILLPENKSGKDFHINVFDVSGRMILDGPNACNDQDNVVSLDLDKANPGLYLVYIYSDDGNCFVKKLVIQR